MYVQCVCMFVCVGVCIYHVNTKAEESLLTFDSRLHTFKYEVLKDFILQTSDFRLDKVSTPDFWFLTVQTQSSMARPSDLPVPTFHFPLLTSDFRLPSQCAWSEPQGTCSLLSFRHDADSPGNSVASYPLTRYARAIKKAKSKWHGSASQPFFVSSRNAPPSQNGCWAWPVCGEERCLTTQKAAVKQTKSHNQQSVLSKLKVPVLQLT